LTQLLINIPIKILTCEVIMGFHMCLQIMSRKTHLKQKGVEVNRNDWWSPEGSQMFLVPRMDPNTT
jgi:hypothetical protein